MSAMDCDNGGNCQFARLQADRELLREHLANAIAVVGKYDPDDVPDAWRLALDPEWKPAPGDREDPS